MNNWIYINTKRNRLNLDTFKKNIVDPILFGLGVMAFFALTWAGFLLAYAFKK